MKTSTTKYLGLAAAVSLLMGTSFSCVARKNNDSQVATGHVPASSPKQQALGNCWLYAAASWIESLVLKQYNREIDISESYFLYRIYEMRLKELSKHGQPFPSQIYSGGEWHEIVDLVSNYGVMYEGDFIPGEANDLISQTQAGAEDAINSSMAYGILSKDHSYEAIEHVLDEVFHVYKVHGNRKNLADKVRRTTDQVRINNRSIAEEVHHWNRFSLQMEGPQGHLPAPTRLTREGQRVMVQVKDHLVQGRALIADWWIDFNALDNEGILHGSYLAQRGPGEGGAHTTNLVDFTSRGRVPNGPEFETVEGEVRPQLQELAIRYGNVTSFIMRNTWGENRGDRPDYKTKNPRQRYRGGYQRLEADYLFSWLPVSQYNSQRNGVNTITGIYWVSLPDYGLSNVARDVLNHL